MFQMSMHQGQLEISKQIKTKVMLRISRRVRVLRKQDGFSTLKLKLYLKEN
jgi:hypothetical protein